VIHIVSLTDRLLGVLSIRPVLPGLTVGGPMTEAGAGLALLGALAMIASVIRGAIKWKDAEFPAITNVSAQILTGIVGLAIFSVGIFLVVGEGRSPSGAAQIDDYRNAASTACQATDKELTALGLPDASNPDTLADFHQGWAVALAKMRKGLQQIEPPSVAASDHANVLTKIDGLVQAFQIWASAARLQDAVGYEQARQQVDSLASNYNNLVLAMGIPQCRLEG
jgi:hypothetical protein